MSILDEIVSDIGNGKYTDHSSNLCGIANAPNEHGELHIPESMRDEISAAADELDALRAVYVAAKAYRNQPDGKMSADKRSALDDALTAVSLGEK